MTVACAIAIAICTAILPAAGFAQAAKAKATSGTVTRKQPASGKSVDIMMGDDAEAPSSSGSSGSSSSNSAAAKAVDDAIAQAAEAGDQGGGTEAILGRLKAVTLKSIRNEMIAFATALGGLQQIKFDLSQVKSVDEIDLLIARFTELRKASVNLLAALKEIPGIVQSELREMKLPEDRMADTVPTVVRIMMLYERIDEQEKAQKMADSALAALQILKRHYGKWAAEGNEIKFQSSVPAEDQQMFATKRGEMAEASKGMAAAQRRMRAPAPQPGMNPGASAPPTAPAPQQPAAPAP